MGVRIEAVSETRNSRSRNWITVPIQAITRPVHKKLTWLSPTHLNILGAAEVGLGAIAATAGKTATAATLIASGSLMDVFDGTLARMMAAEDPKSVDFKKGGIYDVLSDRAQELSLALSRAWSADKRGNTFGKLAALATAVTSPLPSISRAFSESLGKSVPESGKGVIGLIGTRPGRAVLGTVGTLNNESQLGIDIVMTISNLATASVRLRTTISHGGTSLSRETREDAKTRLKVLGAFGAIASVATLIAFRKLQEKHSQEEPEITKELDFMDTLRNVERYCAELCLDHRFVGGTLTDFIGPQTRFEINVGERTVKLMDPNKNNLFRLDGTVKDIDMVVFTPDRCKFLEARKQFAEWVTRARAQGIAFPKISVEAARHPDWPKRNPWKQFVTAWEIDGDSIPHLVFGVVDTSIKPSSIEPWKVDIGDGTQITTLNPIAHALCYRLRVPSGIKRKDKEQIGVDNRGVSLSKIKLVNGLAFQVHIESERQEVNYSTIYKEWVDYIKGISRSSDFSIRMRRTFTGLYWDTIGTQVAHRSGIFSRVPDLTDRMAG